MDISRRANPPEMPAAEMARTAILLVLVILMIGAGLVTFMRVGLRERKVNQRIERAVRDLAFTSDAVRAYVREHGAPPQSEGGALPEDFAGFFAGMRGGAPLHGEMGRISRLDHFSPGRPYSQPLGYFADGTRWVVISRGPDESFDAPVDRLAGLPFATPELEAMLEHASYDPTNGTTSRGDLWLAGFQERQR